MRRAVFLSDLQYFLSEADNLLKSTAKKRKLNNDKSTNSHEHTEEHGDIINFTSETSTEKQQQQQLSPPISAFQFSAQGTSSREAATAAAAAPNKNPSVNSKDVCIVWEESHIPSLAGIGGSASLDPDHSVNKNHHTCLTFEEASMNMNESLMMKGGRYQNIDGRDNSNKLSREEIESVMQSAPLFHSLIAPKTPIFRLLCSKGEHCDKESFKSCYNHIQADLLERK